MNDNYCFSVGCIVRRKNQVLLVRHTYGRAKGKLLIPGGFCHENELPEEAAVREVFEETSITAEVNCFPRQIFNPAMSFEVRKRFVHG